MGKHLDPALTERVDGIFTGENLTEIILHVHLLIERALTSMIAEKLVQPSILSEVQWTFHQKCSLYVGLYNPEGSAVRRLRGFNKLRNAIAHSVDVDVEAAVSKYLIFEKERPDDNDVIISDALSAVRVMAGAILMMDLGAIRGFSHEPTDWEEWDRRFAEYGWVDPLSDRGL